jgi:hypothetical protein
VSRTLDPWAIFFWIAGCVGIAIIETWLILRVYELAGRNGVFAFVLAALLLKPVVDGAVEAWRELREGR